jgi:hypothetical protein
MSIPDKFGRIVKHKMSELKDWFDQVDEEREARAEAEVTRKRTHTDARRELEDALAAQAPPKSATGSSSSSSPLPRRTPEEISRGLAAGTTRTSGAGTAMGGAASTSAPDALDYHYRLLGLDAGSDFATVQSAYNKLAARCDPARFAAGSPEESQAREIRQRLDASYKALRDVLDLTARRFDLLEFDAPIPPPNIDAKADAPVKKNGNLEI